MRVGNTGKSKCSCHLSRETYSQRTSLIPLYHNSECVAVPYRQEKNLLGDRAHARLKKSPDRLYKYQVVKAVAHRKPNKRGYLEQRRPWSCYFAPSTRTSPLPRKPNYITENVMRIMIIISHDYAPRCNEYSINIREARRLDLSKY